VNPIVDDARGSGLGKVGGPLGRTAILTFVALFMMNLLDFLDRNLLMAMQPQIKADFDLDNESWGRLTTIFLLSYSIVSPLMGWLGDRYRRTRLIALGVGVWSVATVASGLAANHNQLALARSFLGIGEATYGVIAPTILIDLFSKETRARLMSGFYLAMPLGSALGMGLGGWIATTWSWNLAFFIVGAPGLIAAVGALFLPEPVRGASEGVSAEKLLAHEKHGPSKADYIDLMVNSSYTYAVFGMCAYTFAIGGMLVWVPPYLFTTRGFDQARAGLLLGLITLAAAVIGMSVGGWAADRLWKRFGPRWLFLVPGIAMLGSVPFVLVGLFSKSEPMIFAGIFLAEMLMFVNTGPCNAIISNVVMPNMRAAAYSVSITAVHFLGDIWSPWLIGYFADLFGDKEMMASPVGRALESLGATATQVGDQAPENIVAGLLIVVPALVLSGVVLLAGARHLPREMALMQAKLKAAPKA
jgi:MFS family permease